MGVRLRRARLPRLPRPAVKPLTRWLLGMAYAALTLAAIVTANDWWRGEIPAPRWYHWLLLACLPLLAWIYLRYLSVFAPGKGQCLLPRDREQAHHD